MQTTPPEGGKNEANSQDVSGGEYASFLRARGVDLGVHETIFQILRSAALLVTALEEAALRPLGLTHAGFRILAELLAFGPREPRHLAAFMLVSRPAIVGNIDTLERRGYVERVRSTEDRRLVTVQLTELGAEVAEQAILAWHECQVAVSSGLTPDERATLARLVVIPGEAALELRRHNGGGSASTNDHDHGHDSDDAD